MKFVEIEDRQLPQKFARRIIHIEELVKSPPSHAANYFYYQDPQSRSIISEYIEIEVMDQLKEFRSVYLRG